MGVVDNNIQNYHYLTSQGLYEVLTYLSYMKDYNKKMEQIHKQQLQKMKHR